MFTRLMKSRSLPVKIDEMRIQLRQHIGTLEEKVENGLGS